MIERRISMKRKLTAIAVSAAMMIALCGCGRQGELNHNTDETKGMDEIIIDENGKIVGDILYNSYRTEEIEGIEEWYYIDCAIGNRLFLYDEGTSMVETHIVRCYDIETGGWTEFTPKSFTEKSAGNDYIAHFFSMPDGKLGLFCNEFYDEKTSRDIIRRCIEVYDEELNYVETQEIPPEFLANQLLNPGNTAMDAQGNWYCTVANDAGMVTLVSYNSNFEMYGEIAFPGDMTVYCLFNGADGSVYASFINKTDFGAYYEVCRLDAEARTCKNIGKTITLRGDYTQFLTGTNGYDFYYTDSYGVYGVKDDTVECAVGFVNSDLPVGLVFDCLPFENGQFFLHVLEGMNETYRIATQRSAEEIANTQVITLSTVGMYDRLESIVIDFNRAETGSRIIVQDYADYNTHEDNTLGLQRLREDLLDGIVADMVCTDGLNFESLAGKGLFADWYDLMEQDAEFNREDYLQNFFESYEYDGKLQRLGISFNILTAAAKTEHAGEEQGRTMEEYMKLTDAMPDGMTLFAHTDREAMISQWFQTSQNSYVNRVKGECYFNNPGFVKFLGLLKELPDAPSPEDWTKDEWDMMNAEDPYIFLEDRALIDFRTFSQPMDYHAMIRTTFRDADVTMLGYPMETDAGNGGIFDTDFTISVNAQSKHKDAVWEFMKHLLSEEYQRKLQNSMPVHRGVLEEKLDNATNQVAAKVSFAGLDVNIGAPEKGTMDALYSYIQSIRTCHYYDMKIYQIMMEETDMFLSGDQTAENAAKMMQSRVSIYLSEQS